MTVPALSLRAEGRSAAQSTTPTRGTPAGARRHPTNSKEVNPSRVGSPKGEVYIPGNSPQPPHNSLGNQANRLQAFPPLCWFRGTAGALGTLQSSPFRSPSVIQKVLT